MLGSYKFYIFFALNSIYAHTNFQIILVCFYKIKLCVQENLTLLFSHVLHAQELMYNWMLKFFSYTSFLHISPLRSCVICLWYHDNRCCSSTVQFTKTVLGCTFLRGRTLLLSFILLEGPDWIQSVEAGLKCCIGSFIPTRNTRVDCERVRKVCLVQVRLEA